MIPYIENGEYYCSNCDTEVVQDWVFCPECGECIEWDEVTDEDAGKTADRCTERSESRGMNGGPMKMSKIADEQMKRSDVLKWQPSEEQEQATVFQWVTLMQNRFPELDLLFHIPNGGLRSKPEAVRFKRIGVKPGVPDLFLPVARGGWHGLFIEMKKKGGRVRPEQTEWIEALIEQRYRAVVCYGSEEACDVLFKYLTETEQ